MKNSIENKNFIDEWYRKFLMMFQLHLYVYKKYPIEIIVGSLMYKYIHDYLKLNIQYQNSKDSIINFKDFSYILESNGGRITYLGCPISSNKVLHPESVVTIPAPMTNIKKDERQYDL